MGAFAQASQESLDLLSVHLKMVTARIATVALCRRLPNVLRQCVQPWREFLPRPLNTSSVIVFVSFFAP